MTDIGSRLPPKELIATPRNPIGLARFLFSASLESSRAGIHRHAGDHRAPGRLHAPAAVHDPAF